jgi:hypothetical protein
VYRVLRDDGTLWLNLGEIGPRVASALQSDLAPNPHLPISDNELNWLAGIVEMEGGPVIATRGRGDNKTLDPSIRICTESHLAISKLDKFGEDFQVVYRPGGYHLGILDIRGRAVGKLASTLKGLVSSNKMAEISLIANIADRIEEKGYDAVRDEIVSIKEELSRHPSNVPKWALKVRDGDNHNEKRLRLQSRVVWVNKQPTQQPDLNPNLDSHSFPLSQSYEFIYVFSKGKDFFWNDVGARAAAENGFVLNGDDGDKRGVLRTFDDILHDNTDTPHQEPAPLPNVWAFEPRSRVPDYIKYPILPKSVCNMIINATTSDLGVCPKCGAQFTRSEYTSGWLPTCSHYEDELYDFSSESKPDPAPASAFVLDMLSGSGAASEAARSLGRMSVGVDINFVRLARDASYRLGFDLIRGWEHGKKVSSHVEDLPMFSKREDTLKETLDVKR